MIQTDPDEIDPALRSECPFCGVTVASNALHQHLPCEEASADG